MEFGLYVAAIFLIFFVLAVCAVAERWIGLCSSCQLKNQIPDLTGNRPTRLEIISVRKPYRVIQPETRGIQQTRVIQPDTRVSYEERDYSPSVKALPTTSSPPHLVSEPQLLNPTSDNISDSCIYQEVADEPEQFLSKVDIHQEIYTVENDQSPVIRREVRRNHQSNYCSFVKF